MLKNLNSSNKNLSILLGLGSGVLVYLTLKQYLRLRKYKHIPGPKARGLFGFFTGNYLDFSEGAALGKTFGDHLLEWYQKHGSVFKFYIFGQVLVSVNDADSIKKVLIDYDSPKYDFVYKTLGFPFKERCLGYGLVTEIDQEVWKSKRALFNHGFQRTVLMNCISEFNEKSNVLMEKLRQLADGKSYITMFNEINRFTLDVIASVAFGINNDSVNDSKNELNSLITRLLVGMNDLLVDPLIEYKPSKTKVIKEFKIALKKLRDYSKEHIRQRIKLLEDKDYVPNDILSIIINNYENDQLDLEELIDQFLTFFIAGQETTANSLAFCILELGKNPDILGKLRDEVDQVLGGRVNITFEDLTNLEYTGAVFKEALRKWPPAPEFSRKSAEDIQIDGFKIPKGSWIVVSPFVSGRNSKYFPEPEKFLPERFIKRCEIGQQNTFSLGPRNCIGQNFAQFEAKIFLAKFIQNFDFKLDPNQSFEAKELLTLRPTDGARAMLSIRNNN